MSILLYRKILGTEDLSNLPKVTKLISDRDLWWGGWQTPNCLETIKPFLLRSQCSGQTVPPATHHTLTCYKGLTQGQKMPVDEQVNRQEEITLNEISSTGLTSSSGHGRNSSWTRESGLTMVANTGCDTCSSQALKRCLPSECQVSGFFQYVCMFI